MAVAVDGTSPITGRTNFTTTITLPGKTSAGSDRCLVIGVGHQGDSLQQISSVTYGGSTTGVTSQVTIGPTAANLNSRQYTKVAPNTAGTDVVITFGDDVNAIAAAHSYTGVDQTTPVRPNSNDTASGSASAPSVTVDPSATGDIVTDCVFGDGAVPSVGAGQTLIFADDVADPHDFAGGLSYETGAATVTMSWTPSYTDWASSGMSVQQAAGGGVASVAPTPLRRATRGQMAQKRRRPA